MLFTSPLFIFAFLPTFLIVYYLAPRKVEVKNYVALAASILFFAWGEPIFVFALMVGTAIDYHISKALTPTSVVTKPLKRFLLGIGIALNIAGLIFAKYLDFIINEIISPLHPWLGFKLIAPSLPLVLGISFITFHRISYLVDSYVGRAQPPRNIFDCALYIFLFPQLIAGPIIRYHDIGQQIHDRTHSTESFLIGFFRFSIGLAKKVLLADPTGTLADKVFGLPAGGLTQGYAWLGILAYTLQIYFDFSAYSDMALGLARMIGFRFPENFNRPYTSQSITEFWRRWHISLSSWMRQYLYIPLGGNQVSNARIYLNLWLVFLISGIWHGASWNFVAWGAFHGLFLTIERAVMHRSLSRYRPPAYLLKIWTLLIVLIGWVFFRSATLTDAIQFLSVMFSLTGNISGYGTPWGLMFGGRDLATLILGTLIACIVLPAGLPLLPVSLRAAWLKEPPVLGTRSLIILFVCTLVLLFVSVGAILSSDYVPFLYFRF